MADNNVDRVLDWDDEIEATEGGFTLLPEGDYSFKIERFERAYYEGSDKVPPCPKAIVYFNVTGHNGESVSLSENFMLHSKFQWKLGQLFCSVGLMKVGDTLQMRWQDLPGRTGRCKVVQVPGYKDPSKTYNRIDKLYVPEGNTTSYTPGAF